MGIATASILSTVIEEAGFPVSGVLQMKISDLDLAVSFKFRCVQYFLSITCSTYKPRAKLYKGI